MPLLCSERAGGLERFERLCVVGLSRSSRRKADLVPFAGPGEV